jgi:hypothetical protein
LGNGDSNNVESIWKAVLWFKSGSFAPPFSGIGSASDRCRADAGASILVFVQEKQGPETCSAYRPRGFSAL